MKTLTKIAAVAATVAAMATGAKAASITEIAVNDERFSTLVAAVTAAGLADTLAGPGPFTVYAPVNDAFAALPAGTVETLLKPENKDPLAAILKHHVVSGRVYADMAAKLDKAPTLNGTELPIAITKESARIGNANIVSTDIEANNGVIHVIDTVLLP